MTVILTKKHVRKQNSFNFVMEMPRYNASVLEAMEEAKSISKDANVKGYSTIQELKAALETD